MEVDCVTRKGDFEKIVCADPKLVSLSEELDKALVTALAAMPEEGRFDLTRSQHEWRRFSVKLCTPVPDKEERLVTGECLDAFTERLSALKKPVVFTLGGLSFRKIDHFSTVPTSWPERRVGKVEISYLQIVNPANAEQRVFNKYLFDLGRTSITRYFQYLDSPRDEDLGYRQDIDFINPEMILVSENAGAYGHGAPHGYGGIYFSTWLVDEMRPLSFYDVFKKDVGAEYHLLDMIYKYVDDTISGDYEERSNLSRRKWLSEEGGEKAKVDMHDTARWVLLKDGLLLTGSGERFFLERGNFYRCFFLSCE